MFTPSSPSPQIFRDHAIHEYSRLTIHLTYTKLQLTLGVTICKADAPYSNHILVLCPQHMLYLMVMVLLLVEDK